VLLTKAKHIGYFLINFLSKKFVIIQMQTQSLAPRSSKIQDFDVELQVLHE
jgi:hypothetical protein